MNLAPIADVYTVSAEQAYERAPPRKFEPESGGLAYGAEPLGMDPRYALQIDKDLLAEDDEKQVAVDIPRYNGPKNTRVDFFGYEQNTFHVTGIANHPQPSCVYLRSKDVIQFTSPRDAQDDVQKAHGTFPVRPNLFFVQRRFKKMFWEAQNVRGVIEVPTHEFVKIAPYICNKDNLERFCKPKWSFEFRNDEEFYLDVTSFEPVLSFQSGWALLDAIRPFNQQNMMYPLAIQDYSMRFEEYPTDRKLQRSYNLKHNRQFGNDFETGDIVYDGMPVLVLQGHDDETEQATNIPFTVVTDNFLKKVGDEKSAPGSGLELVTFSENTAIQANKDVSMVQMHAPEFDVYVKNTVVTHTASESAVLTETFTTDTMLPALKIEIDTPKGFPSLMMFYVEFDQDKRGDLAIKHPLSISTHPRIQTLRISFYGQLNPIIKLLGQSELEYITKKNCHKNSDFKYAYNTDPICLIDLESLGLGREDVGYPSRKRLNCTVECTGVELPARFGKVYANYAERQVPKNFDMGYQFKCVFIYENRVIEGNVNQLKINRKY